MLVELFNRTKEKVTVGTWDGFLRRLLSAFVPTSLVRVLLFSVVVVPVLRLLLDLFNLRY